MNMPHVLTEAGLMRTRSASGLLQALLPRSPKAKFAAVVQSRKIELKSQRNPKPLEAQQLEITGIKKFEIAKLSEKRNAQMHLSAAKAVQNDGETTVVFPQIPFAHLALLKLSILRVRSFASTTLTDGVCQGRQQE